MRPRFITSVIREEARAAGEPTTRLHSDEQRPNYQCHPLLRERGIATSNSTSRINSQVPKLLNGEVLKKLEVKKQRGAGRGRYKIGSEEIQALSLPRT
jgi:hypothetical protein